MLYFMFRSSVRQ